MGGEVKLLIFILLVSLSGCDKPVEPHLNIVTFEENEADNETVFGYKYQNANTIDFSKINPKIPEHENIYYKDEQGVTYHCPGWEITNE